MQEDGHVSGSFRQVRWFHVAVLAAVIGGSLILAQLTARDLRAVGEQVATTSLGQTDGNDQAIFTGYYEAYDGPNAHGLAFPARIGLDTTNHRLFVLSGSSNNGGRVGAYQLNPDETVGDHSLFALLGQPHIKGALTNTSATTFGSYAGNRKGHISFNPTTEQLVLSDPEKNRVLLFDIAEVTTGEAATDAFGQLDQNDNPVFTTSDADGSISELTMSGPSGVAHDALNHRLFVADTNNNRVLVFDLDINDVPLDNVADAVLGQSTFLDEDEEDGQDGLSGPQSLAYDPSGQRLFVADSSNGRVMVFDVSSISSGQDAINVIGRGDFSGDPCANENECTVGTPLSIAYDDDDSRLFVSDGENFRVLVFDVDTSVLIPNNSGTDGPDAINVLGTADFTINPTTPCATPGQCDFGTPTALAFAEGAPDRLFVADQDNHRVLVFNVDTGTIADGENADNVLGKADFTATPCLDVSLNTNQCSTYGPSGLVFDGGSRLFVAQNAAHRVTVFDVAAITDGEDAINVLGQEDYDSFDTTVAADRLRSPNELVYAPGSGMLFAADTGNHRILGFDAGAITDGEPATVVLGQFDGNGDPSFTNGAPNNSPNARGMDEPTSSIVDTVNHRLFVSDSGNHRVLVFDLDAGDVPIDRVADHVLGQHNFSTSAIAAISSASFIGPDSLAYDPTGNLLFVADHGNNRILIFDAATIDDGEGAVNVLGQPDFTTSGGGTTASQFDLFERVGGLSFDDTDNRLFAADPSNSRILVFDTTVIVDGEDAVNVLGQEDFLTSGGATSVDGLNFPRDVVFSDLADLLFVADSSNNRVMVFDVDSTVLVPGCGLACDGPDAVDLIGQLDDADQPLFTTNGQNNSPNKNGFDNPAGIAVDPINQRLWIVDQVRITERDLDPDGDLIDIFPEVVLGQTTFKTNNSGTTQATLEFNPQALTTNGTGNRLFVADMGNNRILVYDFGLSGLASGAPADFVIGQPLFTTNVAAAGPDGLNAPTGLAYDVAGDRLFVADSQNNRVMVYDVSTANLNAEATGSGIAMSADAVLGQPDFISTTFDTTQTTLFVPTALVYDQAGDRVFVLDAENNRVMVFDAATVTNGEPAVAELGQPDFTSGGSTVTQSSVFSGGTIGGLAYDETAQTLFVAAYFRVMVFDVATIDAGGENAVAVVGATDYSGGIGGQGQAGLSSSSGVGWDPEHRRLYVSDANNERVMLFDIVRITTTSIPDATVGQPYNQATNADQVQGALTFTLESGTLPPGLSVGSITGTPTTPGDYTFTIRATDANGPSEFYDLQTYTMTVDSAGGSGGGGGFLPPPGSTPTPSAGATPAPTAPGVTATPRRTPLGSRTPTPTTVVIASPGTTATPGVPASPGPSTAPGPGIRSAIDRLLGGRTAAAVLEATSMLIAVVSIIAILLSAILLSRNLMDLAFMGAFALQSLWVILGLKKRAHIWGTVYDTGNKHPIPFAKVELTDLNGRVLETRFADRDGRYGFLASPEQVRQQSLTVRIKPTASGYLFPPMNVVEGATDFLVYDHVYTGGPVTVAADSFLRYDIPMYRQPWRSTRFSEFFPIKSAGGLMSHVMNIAFWAGVVLVPLAYWRQPTTLNLIVLILFFGVHALRMLTGMYRPFGVVRDVASSKAVPYALVTLNDATGKRRTFAVSDEQGRYFMSSDSGTYQLQTFTPANISPQRSQTTSVTTSSGWVKKKLAV